MNSLDDLLRDALQRREPPFGFADRVMAKVACDRAPRRGPRILLLAASVVALLAPLGRLAHHRQEMHRKEAARAQLLLALEISSQKLNQAFRKLHSNS